MSCYELTAGCFERIGVGTLTEKPILQVLGIKRGVIDDEFELQLSDGLHVCDARISGSSLGHAMSSGNLDTNAIVRIDKYTYRPLTCGRYMMRISDLTLLAHGADGVSLIGNPQPLDWPTADNSIQPNIETAVALVETDSRPLGVTLVNTSNTNKMADCMDLVEMAKQIQKADEFVRANVSNKLTVIVDQIKYLQEQARKVLSKAQIDAELHHVACNMVKKPGNTYHLYCRPSGQKYFSLLSPQEWGASCPHEFIGSYRLEHDMSWTSVGDIAQRESDMTTVNAIIRANTTIVPAPLQLPSPATAATRSLTGFVSNGPVNVDKSPSHNDVRRGTANS